MEIDVNKYTREKLDDLALELGADEAAVKDAKTKADVVALIPGATNTTPDTDTGDQEPGEAATASEGTEFPGYFLVNDQKVDFNGKPITG